MGGHLAGEVASEMAVTRLQENLPEDRTNSLDELVAAIVVANTEIYDGSVADPDRAGMGTTITAIAVVADPHDGQAFGIANVGDSRCYVMRHARLRQLTIDHSFVQELVAEGAINRDEARTHPRRNIVTRALGIEPSVRVDSWTMPIFQGDRLLLCSDGLVDEITDDHISDLLIEHTDPGAAAQALVDAANASGGRDNVTVVVVDVLEGDAPPDPTQEFDVVPLWADEDFRETAGAGSARARVAAGRRCGRAAVARASHGGSARCGAAGDRDARLLHRTSCAWPHAQRAPGPGHRAPRATFAHRAQPAAARDRPRSRRGERGLCRRRLRRS
jgi:protein phosphatase